VTALDEIDHVGDHDGLGMFGGREPELAFFETCFVPGFVSGEHGVVPIEDKALEHR
jgi:hypothetical protein